MSKVAKDCHRLSACFKEQGKGLMSVSPIDFLQVMKNVFPRL